jgi:uncharacterized protein (TIGR03437 family)
MSNRNTWGATLLALSLIPAGVAQTASFGTPMLSALHKGPLTIVAGDLNGDGKQDLAVANSSAATVSILLGNGDGTFASATPASLPAGCGVAFLAIGHFASAAGADLLAVCALGDIEVLPNTGAGAFGPPVTTHLPSGAWVGDLTLGELSPAIADFNRDGHPDLVIGVLDSSALTGAWYFLAGTGDGGFSAPVALNFAPGQVLPLSVVAGDFNGDGLMDVVVNLVPISNFTPTNEFLFAAGKGDGTFAAPVAQSIPLTDGTILIPADVNSDGALDLVIAGSSLLSGLSSNNGLDTGASALAVYLGDGTGKFTRSFGTTQPNFMAGAVLADVRGTGNLDLVGATVAGDFLLNAISVGGLELFPGNGDGTFGSPQPLSLPDNVIPTAIAATDLNGDGRLDLAMPTLPAEGIGSFGGFGFTTDFHTLLVNVLAALPNGTLRVMLNTGAKLPPTFTDANGAGFQTGPQAAASIVSAFGSGLAPGIALAGILPLPQLLDGVSIEVADSAGAARQAAIFYVSPGQINYAIPEATALGKATIIIRSGNSLFQAIQQIVPVSPGIFSANGYAAGSAVRTVNGAQVSGPLIVNGTPAAVDVSGGNTYLVLYGTGIRNHTTPVTALVGASPALTAAYAGPQGTYVGEDQVNILLPASLQGAGKTAVSLVVEGKTSNTVQIVIQ